MFVDASAIVAILNRESDALALAEKLEQATKAITSPVAFLEASLAVARVRGIAPVEAAEAVMELLRQFSVELTPLPAMAGQIAVEAYQTFGKGHHPASLNLGDCLAYAAARVFNLPLLFKGDDFARTDVPPA